MPKKFPGRMTYTQWKRTPFRRNIACSGSRSTPECSATGAIATTRAAAAPARARITNAIGGGLRKLPNTDEVSRVRKRAESWTWLLWEGSSKGSEGRKLY